MLWKVFHDDKFSFLVIETDYSKALATIKLEDREEIVLTLHPMIKGHVELDHFIESLKTYLLYTQNDS